MSAPSLEQVRRRVERQAGTGRGGYDDEVALWVLHLMDVEGLSATQAGRRLGLGRNSVLGLRHRVHVDLAKSEAGDPRPRRHDGTEPPLWWLDGVRAREGGA